MTNNITWNALKQWVCKHYQILKWSARKKERKKEIMNEIKKQMKNEWKKEWQAISYLRYL